MLDNYISLSLGQVNDHSGQVEEQPGGLFCDFIIVKPPRSGGAHLAKKPELDRRFCPRGALISSVSDRTMGNKPTNLISVHAILGLGAHSMVLNVSDEIQPRISKL